MAINNSSCTTFPMSLNSSNNSLLSNYYKRMGSPYGPKAYIAHRYCDDGLVSTTPTSTVSTTASPPVPNSPDYLGVGASDPLATLMQLSPNGYLWEDSRPGMDGTLKTETVEEEITVNPAATFSPGDTGSNTISSPASANAAAVVTINGVRYYPEPGAAAVGTPGGNEHSELTPNANGDDSIDAGCNGNANGDASLTNSRTPCTPNFSKPIECYRLQQPVNIPEFMPNDIDSLLVSDGYNYSSTPTPYPAPPSCSKSYSHVCDRPSWDQLWGRSYEQVGSGGGVVAAALVGTAVGGVASSAPHATAPFLAHAQMQAQKGIQVVQGGPRTFPQQQPPQQTLGSAIYASSRVYIPTATASPTASKLEPSAMAKQCISTPSPKRIGQKATTPKDGAIRKVRHSVSRTRLNGQGSVSPSSLLDMRPPDNYGFVNFDSMDAKLLMSAVAPSGNCKRKKASAKNKEQTSTSA